MDLQIAPMRLTVLLLALSVFIFTASVAAPYEIEFFFAIKESVMACTNHLLTNKVVCL